MSFFQTGICISPIYREKSNVPITFSITHLEVCVGPPVPTKPHSEPLHPNAQLTATRQSLRPPGWGGAGPYRSSVYSIPESIVFRVSFPVHLGRMRFISIQFLSGGRPVVGKIFPNRWSDSMGHLVFSNPVSSVRYVISFQSWSRAPIVTNLGI